MWRQQRASGLGPSRPPTGHPHPHLPPHASSHSTGGGGRAINLSNSAGALTLGGGQGGGTGSGSNGGSSGGIDKETIRKIVRDEIVKMEERATNTIRGEMKEKHVLLLDACLAQWKIKSEALERVQHDMLEKVR